MSNIDFKWLIFRERSNLNLVGTEICNHKYRLNRLKALVHNFAVSAGNSIKFIRSNKYSFSKSFLFPSDYKLQIHRSYLLSEEHSKQLSAHLFLAVNVVTLSISGEEGRKTGRC